MATRQTLPIQTPALIFCSALLLSACGNGNPLDTAPVVGAASTDGETPSGVTAGGESTAGTLNGSEEQSSDGGDGTEGTIGIDPASDSGGTTTDFGTAGLTDAGFVSVGGTVDGASDFGPSDGGSTGFGTAGGTGGSTDSTTGSGTGGSTDFATGMGTTGSTDFGADNTTDGTLDAGTGGTSGGSAGTGTGVPTDGSADSGAPEGGISEGTTNNIGALQGPIGDYGPYADAAEKAYTDYIALAGNNELANLNASNAAPFLDTILFGPIANHKQGQPRNLTATVVKFGKDVHTQGYQTTVTPFSTLATSEESGSRYCSYYSNGPMQWQPSEPLIHNGKSYRQVVVSYNNCIIADSARVFGYVTYAIADEDGDDLTKAQFFKYDNLSVNLFSERTLLTFSGVEALAYGMSCDAARPMRSYMRVKNETTHETWLQENVVASRYGTLEGDPCALFTTDEDEGSVLSGQIAHSTHGVVNIPQTATGFLTSMSFDINGNDSVLGYEKHMMAAPAEISVDEYDIVDPIPMATTTLTVSDQVVFQTTQRRDIVRGGGMASLTDNDADGLSDAWEDMHGLDSSNPADAYSNTDQDYMNATLEYSFGTDPTDDSQAGWLSDHRVSIRIPDNSVEEIDSEYDRYPVRLAIYNNLDRVRSKHFTFSLQLEGEVVFESTVPTLVDLGTEDDSFGEVLCEFGDATEQQLLCEATPDSTCEVFTTGNGSYTECTNNILTNREFKMVAKKNSEAVPGIAFFVNAELAVGSQELHDIDNYHRIFQLSQ